MRRLWIVLLFVAIGCKHDRPSGPQIEEYALPPSEPRFNQPPPASGSISRPSQPLNTAPGMNTILPNRPTLLYGR